MKFLRKFIFQPEKQEALDGEYGGVLFHVVDVNTSDGLTLKGLHSQKKGESKFTILFFHGNGGCAATRAHYVAPLTELGCEVVVADYRGYGSNNGQPSESGLLLDSMAFLDYTRKHCVGPIIVLGHSMGGSLAMLLVSSELDDIAGLVTVGAFTSLNDTVPGFVRPFLPDRFDALSVVNKIRLKWHILHEQLDPLINSMHASRLYEAVVNRDNVQLTILNGGGHPLEYEKVTPAIEEIIGDYSAG